ncbi:MAG: LacI family transcriptional regulator [Prolixibacteraceae bacterium]|jgi:LacI family transcriptional regulator|nr:LacI family transcriptional regulator [Prolixibacteraceae bacterium]
MHKKTDPTIHDIARELNISASTVSRALQNNPRISLKTREKIITLANSVGYRPNTLASNLRNKRSNTIGIVVPLINRYFFSAVISGVEDVAFKAGYTVVISQSNDLANKEISIVHSMLANRVDGLIISIAMQPTNYEHLKTFRKKNIPLLFFDRTVAEIDANKIVVDDFMGGFRVTRHLIEQGYKRIGHMAGPQNLQTYLDRKNGYIEALAKNDIICDESLVVTNSLTSEDGINAVQYLINLPNPPDAIFCGNDTTALSSMIYLRDKGIRIPEDFGIVGFSNEPFSKVVSPSISTIAQPGFLMGQKAAELILNQIEHKEKSFKTLVLPTELIVRESSSRKMG